MKIAVRIDDITPNMNHEKFLRMKKLLDSHGIKPLIGIVPDNMDPMLDFSDENAAFVEKVTTNAAGGLAAGVSDAVVPADEEGFGKYIRSLKEDGWIIALHGLNHVYTTSSGGMFPLNRDSEFASLPYEEQYEMLSYGVQLLEDKYKITTDIFMAPSHSYDKNTLKVLKELGFSAVTDGFGNYPYEYNGLYFYPISYNRKSVIKNSKKDGYTTFVFHPNTMEDRDFEDLEKLLDTCEFISYGDYMKVSAIHRNGLGRAAEYTKASFKRLLVKVKSMLRG